MNRRPLAILTGVSLLLAVLFFLCSYNCIDVDIRRMTGESPRWYVVHSVTTWDRAKLRLSYGDSQRTELIWLIDWWELVGVFLALPGIRLLVFLERFSPQLPGRAARVRRPKPFWWRCVTILILLLSSTVFCVVIGSWYFSTRSILNWEMGNYYDHAEFRIDHAMLQGWGTSLNHSPTSIGRFVPNISVRWAIGTRGPYFAQGDSALWRSFYFEAIPDSRGWPGKQFELQTPMWTLAVLSGLIPFWTLLRAQHRKSQRRIGAGCCASCGYDLRASPLRCPECGAATTKTSEPARADGLS